MIIGYKSLVSGKILLNLLNTFICNTVTIISGLSKKSKPINRNVTLRKSQRTAERATNRDYLCGSPRKTLRRSAVNLFFTAKISMV